jgi:predicted adenine nucleotide alpha hydrolase (AANH) superfamily ATPase
MKILMHMCCSNCSIYPLERFLIQGFGVRGLWYNPNIHPFTEYMKRLDSLEMLQTIWGLDIEYMVEYPLERFLNSVMYLGEERCAACYAIRLDKTAETAKEMRFDFFTTSLLASPHQKFDMIIRAGRNAGVRYGIEFYVEDFRQGRNISRELSMELGLYRQKYCGCIFSEKERYGRLLEKKRKEDKFGGDSVR